MTNQTVKVLNDQKGIKITSALNDNLDDMI